MKTIWKFVLPIADECALDMPPGAQILTCQEQSGMPVIWAVVDSSAPMTERRRFRIFGTGQAFDLNWPNDSAYVGTFQVMEGALVFHVFEVRQ